MRMFMRRTSTAPISCTAGSCSSIRLIPRVALHSLRPTLAEHGLADEEEIARLDQELEEAKNGSVQWVSSPLMLEWIARKP